MKIYKDSKIRQNFVKLCNLRAKFYGFYESVWNLVALLDLFDKS